MPNASEAELERFFLDRVGAFDTVAAAQGHLCVHLTLAHHCVDLHMAGRNVAHLLRPMTHLCRIPGVAGPPSPSWDILAWAGGAPPACMPWTPQDSWFLGELAGLHSDRFLINTHPPSGLLCMLDTVSRRAIYWIPDAKDLPYWEIASPFRVLFHWWAQRQSAHLAHAAVVGKDGHGVLIVGRGGSGKSSLAMACVEAGMDYVGDDYVLLTRDSVPMAHSLYHTGKLHGDFLEKVFPSWKSCVAHTIGPERKALFFLHECKPAAVCPALTIDAIIVPSIGSTPSSALKPLPPAEALLALAPSTIFQLPGARHTALPFFAQWMKGLPVYKLACGSDLQAGPAALCRFLEGKGVEYAA